MTRISRRAGLALASIALAAAAAGAGHRAVAFDAGRLGLTGMRRTSVMHGGGTMQADSTIKYTPEKTVLRLSIGDPIALDAGRFQALAKAVFADIALKFS